MSFLHTYRLTNVKLVLSLIFFFTLDFIDDKKGSPHIKFYASLKKKKNTPILQFYVITSNDVIIWSD